jgi:hypothetical protein
MLGYLSLSIVSCELSVSYVHNSSLNNNNNQDFSPKQVGVGFIIVVSSKKIVVFSLMAC